MRHRLDANHQQLRQAAERLGWYWWDASQTDLGVDAFLVKAGRIVPVEVKDGSKAPSEQRLTPREERTQATLAVHGVRVELLTCLDDLQVLERPQRARAWG